MKKFTKILSIVMAMALCVGIGVGATLAWLTDTADQVVNTFSPADLIDPTPDPKDPDHKAGFDIWEHEAHRKDDGTYELLKADSKLEADLVKASSYTVVPNNPLLKDPFVRVKTQEAGYVFLEVCGKLPETMIWSVDANEWEPLEKNGEAVLGEHGGKMYAYKSIVTPETGALDINILTGAVINVTKDFQPASLEKDTLLTFWGYATQSTGFKTAQAAWDATFGAPKAA